MEALTKKRNRQPMKESTKERIRQAMLKIGHKPPSQLGKKRSAESIKRISDSKKGFTHSEETRKKMSENRKGENNHFYGKTHSDKAKKVMSKAKIGKRPSNYIEDRTKVKLDKERGGPLHKEWSKSVKKRDKWECQLADKDCHGNVVAHHIYPWALHPELRYKINNGITLCHFHHPRKREDEKRLIPKFIKLVSTMSSN